MSNLTKKRCKPWEGAIVPLGREEALALLAQLPDWQVDAEGKAIYRPFLFRNFHETMAFVNAVAWISHQEDHHPDLEVGYKRCLVRYSTHAIGGLSENDFICAEKINHLLQPEPGTPVMCGIP